MKLVKTVTSASPPQDLAPRPIRLPAWGAAALAVCATAACVTINIYFPAAAAEKAADRIIEEVYQLRQGAPAAKPAESK